VLSRQEWYDAELRQIGVLVHAPHSRRHMIVCFLIRRVLGAIALLAFFAQVVILATLSIQKKAADPTPAYLTKAVRTSQIVCAILTILIQVYHWKALLGVAAVLESGPNFEESNKNDLIASMEDGQVDQIDGDQKSKVGEPENRELSYSEIVTGDRSHCGYSSHQQRTETYIVNNLDDDDEEDETKPDYYESDNLNDKRRKTRITSKRSSIRFQAYKKCETDVDVTNLKSDKLLTGHKSEGIGCENTSNDVTSLLNDGHHSQLSSHQNPIVSDKTTWVVVMATCICFLITAIPASLRSYLSAFLLYSLTTRVLEIITASLLLSPFQIQNTPFRKRLAAKIRGGPVISSTTPTTVACRQDMSITDRFVRGGENKKIHYSDLVRSDVSPSSLTVSILHKPSAAEGPQDAKSNVEKQDNSDEAEGGEKVNSSEIDSLPLLVNEEPEDDKASLMQYSKTPDSQINENTAEKSIRKDVSPPQHNSAWIDRWAKNARVVDSIKSPIDTSDLNRDSTNTSPTNSATSPIKVAGASQPDSTRTPRQGSATPPNPTTQSLQSVLSEGEIQPVINQTHEVSGAQIKESAQSVSSAASDSKGHRSEVSKQSGGKSATKSESPRSVAMSNMDPISPLTGSVMSPKTKVTVQSSAPLSVSQVTGMMNLTSIRPQQQDNLDSGRGDPMKISVVTKEGYSRSSGKKASGHSKTAENYYERWQNQSQSQSQSKLTFRGGSKAGAEEGRSPHSPNSPEVICYDGDVDGENSDVYRKIERRKYTQKGGSKISSLYPVPAPNPTVILSKSALISTVDNSDTRPRTVVCQSESELRQKEQNFLLASRKCSDEVSKKM
jgi:hypothetical protein